MNDYAKFVNYDKLDGFKRLAQMMAKETVSNIIGTGFEDVGWSRGESVHLVKTPFGIYLGTVIEGLGTKNLVADYYGSTEETFYDKVLWDTLSAGVNDCITNGIIPLDAMLYLGVGGADWFDNGKRNMDAVLGFKLACDKSECLWGGGETPALKGIINPETSDLVCSVMGYQYEGKIMNPYNMVKGDRIIGIGSSGLHINGYSLARKLAKDLANGYQTNIGNGVTYGEVLLEKSYIYVSLIKRCLENNIPLKYGINVSGHGWRKLMRHTRPFEYVMEKLPENKLPIFDFIQEIGGYTNRFMYETLNMDLGYILIVAPEYVSDVLIIAKELDYYAFDAGYLKESDTRKVNIVPINEVFDEDSLNIR